MILKKIKIKPFSFAPPQVLTTIYTLSQNSLPAFDLIQTSKTLRSLFKSGRSDDARKLFDEIPEKNDVYWSIMIHGYATNGVHGESLKLFSQMQIFGFIPNSFTVVGILVTSVGLRHLVLGQSVHGLVVKTGLDSNSIVATALLDTYAKCGNIVDSYKIFERMHEPSLISCNAMIAGFTHNELLEEAFVLFTQFRQAGLVPNSATVLTIIRGCIALGYGSLCKSVHGLVIKDGLYSILSVVNSILDMYSSFMDLDAAKKIFSNMASKDIISWTTMIGLLVHLEYASEALNLSRSMRNNGVYEDEVVMMKLTSACSLLEDLKMGRSIHAQIVVCGFGSELPLENSLISMYSKCGDLKSSRLVFDWIAEKSIVSFTSMVSGYVNNGQPRNALDLLIVMKEEEEFGMDSAMLNSVLMVCGELACLELCQQLQCLVVKLGFPRFTSVQNSLISTYSKCGDVELAHGVFKDMDCPNSVSWNAIIYGYGINGRGKDAVALFQEMEMNGENADSATYLCVLTACSHSGLVDAGLTIFNQMVEKKKIRPSKEHFGCVVDMLSRAGHLFDARMFVGKLSECPNTWKALLSGCRIHNNVELAEFAGSKVLESDAKEPGQVVLLSNVYASMGRFKEAEALRLSMKSKGLIKNPGRSSFSGMLGDF